MYSAAIQRIQKEFKANKNEADPVKVKKVRLLKPEVKQACVGPEQSDVGADTKGSHAYCRILFHGAEDDAT